MNLLRVSGAGVFLMLTACASSPRVDPQQQPEREQVIGARPMPPGGLGVAGDSIYMIDHHVAADKRQQFEAFVHDILWPAFAKTATGSSAAGDYLQKRIRFLQPQSASDDGSYTYTFILDPVVPGETYNVLNFLRGAYGEAQALQHYGVYTATWTRDFTVRRFVQSR